MSRLCGFTAPNKTLSKILVRGIPRLRNTGIKVTSFPGLKGREMECLETKVEFKHATVDDFPVGVHWIKLVI